MLRTQYALSEAAINKDKYNENTAVVKQPTSLL